MINEYKVFLFSNKDAFSEHINDCLKEDSFESEIGLDLPKYIPDIIIINLLSLDHHEEKIDEILKSKIKKIILIENALDIYLNSKNTLPYSVFTKIVPKNKICEDCLRIEQKIIDSKKQHVIFRVSEIYGVSMPSSIIEDFLFIESGEFQNSVRDFIYDGDVVSAIEIALKKGVSGIFDIASGNSIELKKLVELIKNVRKTNLDITWKRKNLKVSFNCDNFKFYKWEPLVSLEVGLKTLLTFRRNHGKLRSTSDSRRKDF